MLHVVLSVTALCGLLLAACGNPGASPAAPPTAPRAAQAAAPAGAAAQSSAAPAAPAPASIKVGVTPVLTVSGLYVALERGYFAEQGIGVTMENITDPTTMVPSLATNQIDVGNGALSAGLWNAVARGADLRLVALQSAVRPGVPSSAYIVRQADLDSGFIGDFASLKGKRVSINGRGNFTHIVLVKSLERGGLTQADVDLVDMGQPDAMLALANGSIDLASLSEPIRTAVLAQGGTAVWKEYSEVYPGQQATGWVYSPQFAAERPDVGRRTMVALLRGIRDLYDGFNRDVDREEIVDVVARYLGVRDRGLYATMRLAVDPNGEFDAALLQDDVDWYVANGFSPQRVEVSRSIDRGFVDYAIEQLGRYQ
jgi:NitT/TauT family transport system substrate-binding protein